MCDGACAVFQVCDIIGHKYFQPIQSAKEAEALLSENSSFGTFLFRFSSHPGDYAVSCTRPHRVGRVCRARVVSSSHLTIGHTSGIAQVEKEGKVTRVHLTHDRFTRTADNKFKYRNKVYDDLEAVYKVLKLEKGLQAPYQVPTLDTRHTRGQRALRPTFWPYSCTDLRRRRHLPVEEQRTRVPQDRAGEARGRADASQARRSVAGRDRGARSLPPRPSSFSPVVCFCSQLFTSNHTRTHHSGRAMTRVISEQFEGEEIPKNLRKMLVKGTSPPCFITPLHHHFTHTFISVSCVSCRFV